MVTSEPKTASGLHMFRIMKSVAVVILAMVALSGCGVGAGEHWDGEKLVDANGQALEFAPGEEPVIGEAPVPQVPMNTAGGSGPCKNPGLISLPQDPIPVQPLPLDARGLPAFQLPLGPNGAPLGLPPPKY